ncbi:MAG: hypothetical protein H6836_01355 [Planctomycetes bacterium]|nr:hypothetical protein [Planctomycetota bacterium]
MTAALQPPGMLAASVILGRLAVRRLSNRCSALFATRRRTRRPTVRGAAPVRLGVAAPIALAIGLLLATNGVLLAGQVLHVLADAAASAAGTAEALFVRGASLLLGLSFAAVVLLGLGTGNRELGRAEWTFPGLLTLPVSRHALLLGKVVEYALIQPTAWLVLLPLTVALALRTEPSGAALLIAIGATLCLSAMAGAARLLAEVWLRRAAGAERIRNIQGGCTLLGVLALYAVSYLALAPTKPEWLPELLAALPDALAWLPCGVPVLGIGAASHPTAAGALVFGSSAVVVAVLLVATAGVLRLGPASPARAGRCRRASAAVAALAGHGIVGKEVRLLLRDRTLMVQTLVLPVVVLGFQLLINPALLTAAGEGPQHAAMLAFAVGAYVVAAGCGAVLGGEGGALWLLYTFPRPIGAMLHGKVRVWASIGGLYAAVVLWTAPGARGAALPELLALAAVVVGGVWIHAFLAAAIAVLCAGRGLPAVERRVRSSAFVLFLALAGLYGHAVYAGDGVTRFATVVLAASCAAALWQRVRARERCLVDAHAAVPRDPGFAEGAVASLVCFVLGRSVAGAPDTLVPAAAVLAVGACVAIGRLLRGCAWRGDVEAPQTRIGWIAVAVLVGALCGSVTLGYVWAVGLDHAALAHAFPTVPFAVEERDVLRLLAGVVLAPAVFEWIHRGMVLRGLLALRIPAAVPLGAGLSMLGAPPWLWPAAFLQGAVTGWVFGCGGTAAAASCHAASLATLCLLAKG